MCLKDMGIHPVGFIDLSYGVKLKNKTLRGFKNPKGLLIYLIQ